MPANDSSRRQQGVVSDWDDDRGFGFLTPVGGGSRVFVHVSAFPRGVRPVAGAGVTYVAGRDERNRPRASEVRLIGGATRRGHGGSQTTVALTVAALFFAVLVGLFAVDELPATLLAAYGLLSVVAFLTYRADKAAAVRGAWRTPESTLHALDLLGGWPGALVARKVFRHKTTKQPFRTIFWLTVVANCAALAWFLREMPLTLP